MKTFFKGLYLDTLYILCVVHLDESCSTKKISFNSYKVLHV